MTRVMWLLNHRTARKFEIPMLKRIGINEIFLPKSFPPSINVRSADVDYSEDVNLTIPTEDLDVLNETNWYGEPSKKSWDIANKHFDVLFFIAQDASIFKNIRHFKGAIIWRVFGLEKNYNYTNILKESSQGLLTPEKMGTHFWFGQAYENLHKIESTKLQKRSLFLPLGLNPCDIDDKWEGNDKRIFFVCPDLVFNSYYRNIYANFCADFGDLPYVCGGAQPIATNDPHVLGFVPNEVHENNMRQLRVMFYHSTEPNHIHYHPFEAIRAGMPLVFLAGGMLDNLGGINLPGRCTSIKQARKKLKRILNGDWSLIKQIRQTQTCLLNPMRLENCEQNWHHGFTRILNKLAEHRQFQATLTQDKKRIAVIVPIGYRGGTLQGAKMLAKALWEGSRECGEEADIVFAYPEKTIYEHGEFDNVFPSIACRPFHWRKLNAASAQRAMNLAGYSDWRPSAATYIVPDDNMQQFVDCDIWVMVSDRLEYPLLPIRPYTLMVYDYLQRYVSVCGNDELALSIALNAQQVITTTHFTEQDALQYAGLEPKKVHKLPMLAPDFTSEENPPKKPISLKEKSYFIWPTNAAPHKNHVNALKALKIYYEELGGLLKCYITGVNTKFLFKNQFHHLIELPEIKKSSRLLKENLSVLGELSVAKYKCQLSNATFLWHPTKIDNGTFSVIEAAHLNVPSLSSNYPAMHEINNQFNLNLTWQRSDNPKQMASQLKWMEENVDLQRTLLPTKDIFSKQDNGGVARQYWEVIAACQ